MSKCSFCSQNIEPGTGVTVIRNDGKIFRFDSRKCEVSMLKMGRDSRDTNWVRKMKGRNN
jgi:large subunit ribosomal protein L24e